MAVIPYTRQTNFVAFETGSPTAPKRGTDLDAEFDAAADFSARIAATLSKIQRDDDQLRNLAVTPDSLSTAVRALLLLQGADIRGPWVTGTAYNIGDVVEAPSGEAAICYAAHTAGASFVVDQSAYWLIISGSYNDFNEPRTWTFVGDGVTKTFPIPGADIGIDSMYEVTVAAIGQTPTTDFHVNIAPDPNDSTITFTTAPADQADGSAVLRGYTVPAPIDYITQLLNDPAFLTFLENAITNTLYETTNILRLGPLKFLIPLADVPGGTTVDGTKESYLLRATGGDAATFTIRANTGDPAVDWDENPISAPYFSILQRGDGQVTVVGDAGVTVSVPPGFLAKTRGKNSVITATCDYASGGQWVLSGDLAPDDGNAIGSGLPVQPIGSTAGVMALDLGTGTFFDAALTEDVASWNITNPPAAGYARSVYVRITQNAAAAKTVAWPASFKWAGGTKPSVSTGLSAIDLLTLTTFNGGTSWIAKLDKALA